MTGGTPFVIAVIGAGPRGVGIVERLAARSGDRPTRLHVIDPHLPGGRVWRTDQSPLLWMNSPADEVTMFTDSSVERAGPVRPGPTLYAWARTEAAAAALPPDLAREARTLAPGAVATRRLCGAYLGWCLERGLRGLPATWQWHTHRTHARSLRPGDGTRLTVLLGDGTRIHADRVVLAVGNLDGTPTARQHEAAEHARRRGGHYTAPGYTSDLDLSPLPAGQDVLVRGLGLAFLDVMILLSQGRGGTFRRTVRGDLRYLPSGREPVLWACSLRGMPMHPRPAAPAGEPGTTRPRFATERAVRSLLAPALAGGDRKTCEHAAREVWRLVLRDMTHAHYAQLYAVRPEDTAMSWDAFAHGLRTAAADATALEQLVRKAVPHEEDRFRPARAHPDPLAPDGARTLAELNLRMRAHLTRTILRTTGTGRPLAAAAQRALVTAVEQVVAVLTEQGPALTPESALVARSMAALAREAGSGAPPERIEQLAALHDAGLVGFLGRDPGLALVDSGFEIRAHPLPDRPRRSRHLVDAWLPDSDLNEDASGLLPDLVRSGTAQTRTEPGRSAKLALCTRTFRIVSGDGRPDPRVFALGDFASGGALGALSRPGTNAAFFRQNDCVAAQLVGAGIRPGDESE
ncbi:FAD/NAD(P)-binding protein [Streptomyces sp. NPDC005805]|uniref:FAD/NAD(P)-binding protein n=1 Tax=Streptomyces sp. NPDC005805 TaxID=3157068 RepID=UPI0034002239